MVDWHCKCGNTGIYKRIFENDTEKTIFLCYCDSCRKDFKIVRYRKRQEE
jgi:hypothetical protein